MPKNLLLSMCQMAGMSGGVESNVTIAGPNSHHPEPLDVSPNSFGPCLAMGLAQPQESSPSAGERPPKWRILHHLAS